MIEVCSVLTGNQHVLYISQNIYTRTSITQNQLGAPACPANDMLRHRPHNQRTKHIHFPLAFLLLVNQRPYNHGAVRLSVTRSSVVEIASGSHAGYPGA
jgi:hypothetical protein